jgi:hypothetical protein
VRGTARDAVRHSAAQALQVAQPHAVGAAPRGRRRRAAAGACASSSHRLPRSLFYCGAHSSSLTVSLTVAVFCCVSQASRSFRFPYHFSHLGPRMIWTPPGKLNTGQAPGNLNAQPGNRFCCIRRNRTPRLFSGHELEDYKSLAELIFTINRYINSKTNMR